MRLTLSTAALAALAVTTDARADIIVDQPDALEGGIASQVFDPPFDAYTCSAMDDFTIAPRALSLQAWSAVCVRCRHHQMVSPHDLERSRLRALPLAGATRLANLLALRCAPRS